MSEEQQSVPAVETDAGQPTEDQAAPPDPPAEETTTEDQAAPTDPPAEETAASKEAEAGEATTDTQADDKKDAEAGGGETAADANAVEDAGEKPTEEATPVETDGTADQQSSAVAEPPTEDKSASEDVPADTENVGTGTNPTTEVYEVDPGAQSPEPSGYDLDATATVKTVLMPSGQVATLRCHLGQTFRELKEHFANELKTPVEAILFMFDGEGVENDQTLGGLGVGPNGTVRLELTSADPINHPIKPFKPRQEYHMPDVITVRVQSEGGAYKDVVVEIERHTRKKPFLGGYRHKKSSIEFHHASAQTAQKTKPPTGVEKFCRDTQTVQQRHSVQQTKNDMSTQMTKIGVYVSNMPDKMLVPGKYTTAEEHKARILNQVVMIQKYYRRWLAKRYVEQVKDDKVKRLEWEREEEVRKRKEKEARIRKEFERRMNPKSKEDFDLLYHALEKWRQEEMERINVELSGAERKAALCQLLEQETQLIASIGRHKIESDSDNKQKNIQGFLEKAAAPKRWKGPDGRITEMDTPYTLRAQQLKDIYSSINMKYLTQDERLDVLLTLKHTVKEHDCKLTQEIIELIDREADLLMRGVKESNLDGLRKRIATLFLQYTKTPTFNPEAARLLKVPQDASSLRKNIYFCSSCNQYLPSTDFQLSSNSKGVGRCRKCLKIDNDARVRQDFGHYRFMLKSLRAAETNYGDGSKIAFLLQESDLRHLVENVWSSQSALSAWDDLYDLTLVRWDKHEEWSPWNCVLLTKEEASAHEKLENMEEAYGSVFIHKVKHKHTLARNYFSRLPGMAEHMHGRASSGKINGPSVNGKSLLSANA